MKSCIFAQAILLMSILLLTTAALAEDHTGKGALSTTVDDQTTLSVTVYNVNLGLVKDHRTLRLPSGRVELRFMDVASQLIPASVSIRSLSDEESLSVLEQNYEYDLLSPQKLLDKYVGKEVKLSYKNPYTDKEEILKATLLSNNVTPIYKIGDEITFGHPGRVIFPGVPESLISRPTLVWLLNNKLADVQKVEALYLTNGITWRADYVVTLNEKDDRADLAGWVTIDNKSGAEYRNAQLKLIAGDVHRVKEEVQYREKTMRVAAAAPADSAFKEESFFEYHIYTLQRPSTIKDNQTKQISLINADNISVKKELIFKGSNYYYFNQYGDQLPKQKIGVFIEMQNRKENSLGIPLPKGTVRVYKRDKDGSLQFIGEDSIDHTPKDEKVRIMIGDAFDVVGTRKQTDWKKIAKNIYEASFEISLNNHKKEDAVVKVVEPIPGDWTILNSSHEYKKTEAFTAEFLVPVPKDQEVKLTYTVRMKY